MSETKEYTRPIPQGTVKHRMDFLDTPYGSNDIRLSLREWLLTGFVLMLAFALPPVILERLETFTPSSDYRIPEPYSRDYHLFSRLASDAAKRNAVLVLGDSVMWGQYVPQNETLSVFLMQQSGKQEFVNLGINGMHPAALAGLVRYYGTAIRNQDVILHCNFLWMSSPERDLRVRKDIPFNHPDLVPQFFPFIPSYRESFSHRVGVVITRSLPFYAWVSHIRITCMDNMDFANWTIQNPYADPFSLFSQPRDPLDDPRPDPVPWTQKKIAPQNMEWAPLSDSIQWLGFEKATRILLERGNRLFVLVGPFNVHLLTDESRVQYEKLRAEAVSWLGKRNIAFLSPPPLESEHYADASHPLAEGYQILSNEILAANPFPPVR
ncbi:MAG TPA: hypothetical protein PLQ35_09005 [bacterium]|nr:hypothetical protein [bacterium]HQL62419.1 hypothetical protein [bacterium]